MQRHCLRVPYRTPRLRGYGSGTGPQATPLRTVSGSGSWNRDRSPTGQFTDTHFEDNSPVQYMEEEEEDRIEDSSPTELKTVHRQILYCIYMESHNFHKIY